MSAQPADGLGDGTATVPLNISVDVTKLTRKEAWDYRRDLILALHYPGTDFDIDGPQAAIDRDAYKDQLRRVEDYLTTFDVAS